MSTPWERRSAANSSNSSGSSFQLANRSFEGATGAFDLSLLHNNATPKPSTKLLALRPSRHHHNVFTDPDSFFFNASSAGHAHADDSFSSVGEHSFVGNFHASTVRSTRLLPAYAADPTGTIRADLTVEDVLRSGQLLDFVLDRHGAKFLEASYPEDANDEMHRAMFEKLTEQKEVFAGLCKSATGNFIVQKLMEHSTVDEQNVMLDGIIEGGLMDMCRDKFACRVVQFAIQKFEYSTRARLLSALSSLNLVRLCTDQCGIHVIQRIVKQLPVPQWTFFVTFLCLADNLMSVCQDKYGCRLVQQAIDKMAEQPKAPCFPFRLQLLHSLMTCVVRNCYRLSSNEFANYVVQHIVKSSGVMEMYRDTIIDKCLLRNLLSMSQDKYASHVVEGAFLFAPPTLLTEMMDEIFDGYVREAESNRDALDILLFHQFGNYVVQQMITICTSALIGKEERQLSSAEYAQYSRWYERIKSRVVRHASRLERFSSGKKIIDSVARMSVLSPPIPPTPAPSLMNLTAQFDALFPFPSFLARGSASGSGGGGSLIL
ncbi:unnamed protein product [Caenorhabditis sp. 36 PRJEB53466]|nr:unnamed protein product [Caenorhabditis sp. 36 PRJEB53466]